VFQGKDRMGAGVAARFAGGEFGIMLRGNDLVGGGGAIGSAESANWARVFAAENT